MVIIFAHHYDEEAKWLYQNLPGHCGVPVKLVIAEALGIDYYISLSVKKDRSEGFVFFNDTSELVASEDISFVINRLTFINPIAWNKSDQKEKAYATSEINAFFAAFIYSYKCPVINNIRHGSLIANSPDTLQLIKIVTEAGVTVHPFVLEENENSFKQMETNAAGCLRLMIWDNEIFFPPHQATVGCINLFKKTSSFKNAGCTNELFFTEDPAGFELIYISKSPALSIYGQPFLQYLSETVNILQPCF